MTDDIVERLRQIATSRLGDLMWPPPRPVCTEAADEIERLRAALTEIRDLHQPTEPVLARRPTCIWCGAADGSWPCDTRLLADEALRRTTDDLLR